MEEITIEQINAQYAEMPEGQAQDEGFELVKEEEE